MSDRPNDRTPRGAERRSGWRTPDSLSDSARRAVQDARASTVADASAASPSEWREVALSEFAAEPRTGGAWHLPKPENTSYVAPASDADLIPVDGMNNALDRLDLMEDGSTPILNLAPAQPQEDGEAPLPFDDANADGVPDAAPAAAPEGSVYMGARSIDPGAAALVTFDDEDEEDSDAGSQSFSMSELIALASLADAVNNPGAAPAAQPAAETFDPNDPASYARRQLELLQQQAASAAAQYDAMDATGTSNMTPTDTGTGGFAATDPALDPAEYARQQLARLQGGAPVDPYAAPVAPVDPYAAPVAPPAASGTPTLTAEERVLAQKFHDAEGRVGDLRRMYQSGQIDRTQFEQGLRGSMVLDDNRLYWMLGTESDRWYKHENNQWLPATPPVLEKEAASGAGVSGGFEAGQTVPTQTVGDAWIPARVPVSDPEATMPGTGGIFLSGDQVTVPARPVDPYATMPSASYTDPTVPVGTFNQTVPSDPIAAPFASPVVTTDSVPVETPLYEDAVQRQRQNTARTLAIAAAVIAGLVFLVGTLTVVGAVLSYNNLADPYREEIAALANYQPQFQTARILAADGSLIAELTSTQGGARTRVALGRMSPEIIHAIVSVENERFYEDPGFDVVAIGRAFLQNLTAGEIESGASTITQQIARNLILEDNTVSAGRKLQEIVVAAEIARQYDKNFILELYLNEIFFGNQSYGVEAASQFYFKHAAQELNLAEAAMLAGLIQAPARFDPVINRNDAFARMNEVLVKQAQVGCLQFQHAPYDNQPFCVTSQQATSPQVVLQKARVETANYLPREFQVRYPHFVNYIQQQIEASYGTNELFRRGLTIRTTLVPRIQEAAQTNLRGQVAALSTNGVNTGAVMVTNPVDGAILAMIGSPNFGDETIDGQVNNVFTWQQPGSAIKPVVYTAALEGVERNGTNDYLTAATILWDVPTSYTNPDYAPVNYDRRFHGPQAVRYALANSYNIPAVKTLAFIGADKFRETGERMGLRFLPDATFGLPSALGANDVRLYDMMQMYGTLANNGLRAPLYAITGVTTADDQAVALSGRDAPTQVVQPQIAFLMQSILSDNSARTAAFGANTPLVINGFDGRVAAKTGTTNDNRDLWTMGFSKNFVVGVWIGRHDNQPTVNTNGLAASPIWNAVMTTALQGTNPGTFAPPQGIVQQQVCVETGTVYDINNVPTGCRSVRTEYFVASAPPAQASNSFVQAISIDTWSGMRANQFCPDYTTTGTFASIGDSSAVAWLNTPEGQAYAQSIGLPSRLSPAPSAQCDANTINPQVRFTNITDGQQLAGQAQIQGVVTGPNFQSFRVEIAPSTAPDAWETIAGPFGAQQPGGVLATWDTTTRANGAYRMRLNVAATNGGFASKIVNVGLNNQPTPTPTLPLPTLFVPTLDLNVTSLPFPTLIPFDNSGGSAGVGVGATATPGFVPMGGLSVQPPTPTIFQGG